MPYFNSLPFKYHILKVPSCLVLKNVNFHIAFLRHIGKSVFPHCMFSITHSYRSFFFFRFQNDFENQMKTYEEIIVSKEINEIAF